MLALENAEEVLQILDRYTKQKSKDIPPELDEYLNYVAKTGDTVYRWPTIQYLFREKLVSVIKEFHDTTASIEDLPQCPNVDQFNYETMKTALLERLEHFHSAPFTIQRICELLTDPKKHYSRLDKFMRALEKNILVVSTVEPGRKPADNEENGDEAINGDIISDINIDMEIKKNILKTAENANGNTAANDVIKHHVEIKEIPAASTSTAASDISKPTEATKDAKPIVTEAEEPPEKKNGVKSEDAAAATEEEDLQVDDIDMGLKDHELLGDESKEAKTDKTPEKEKVSGVKIEELPAGDKSKVNLTPDLIEQPPEGELILPSITIENVDNIDATIASQLVHEPIVAKALDEVAKIIDDEMKGEVSLNDGDKLEDIGKIVSNDPILSDAQLKTDDKIDEELDKGVKNDDLTKANLSDLESIQEVKPIADVAVTPAGKHSREADDDGLDDDVDDSRSAKKVKLDVEAEEKKTNKSILDEPIPQDILAEAVEVAEEVEAAKARKLAAQTPTETVQPTAPATNITEPIPEQSASVLDKEAEVPVAAVEKPVEAKPEPVEAAAEPVAATKPSATILPATEDLKKEKAAGSDQADNVAPTPEKVAPTPEKVAPTPEKVAAETPAKAVVENKPVEHIIPIVLETDAKPIEEKPDIATEQPIDANNDNRMIESTEPANTESMAVEETDGAAVAAEDAMEEGPAKGDEEKMDVDESNSNDPMDL